VHVAIDLYGQVFVQKGVGQDGPIGACDITGPIGLIPKIAQLGVGLRGFEAPDAGGILAIQQFIYQFGR
jgi:hypothetical protein